MSQQILDKNTDLCQDEENNTWYFQRFLEKPKYDIKESKEYQTREEAMEAYISNTIKW